MLPQKREDSRHVGCNIAIHAEEVGNREVAPIITVPPCQQEIGDAGGLARIGSSASCKVSILPRLGSGCREIPADRLKTL